MIDEKLDINAVVSYLREQNSKALEHPDSVQVMYRPVLQSPIPDIPKVEDRNYAKNLEWWTEQTRRCMYGWEAPNGHFINPIYYFFLNFGYCFIVNELTNLEDWDHPLYRDGDEDYFNDVYECLPQKIGNNFYNAVNYVVAKARRKGWTTAELFGINMWFFVFNQKINTTRAYPDDGIKEKERKLFRKSYEMIHPFFKIDENGNELSIILDNERGMTQGYKINSKVKLLNSIWMVTANKKGTGVRGDITSLITIVEAGIHTHLSSFIAAAEKTFSQGVRKIGLILIGGTSDAINNESTDYKNIFYNPEGIQAKARFTPADKCFLGAINYFTGESHREYATYLVKEQRKLKVEGGDVDGLKMAVQEEPLRPEEAFIPSGSSEYDEDKIDNQIMHILANGLDKQWIRGKLEWVRDVNNKKTDQVYFKQDPNGLWCVLDIIGLPIKGIKNVHIAGIDDVYKDKAPHSSSKNAMVIWRKETVYYEISDLPIAYYLGRHKSRMIDYEEFQKATIFWDTRNMYEYNDSGGFVQFSQKNGIMSSMIYHNGDPGIRLSTPIKNEMTMIATRMFKDDRHTNIASSDIMLGFKLWGGKNTDVGSATHLALLGLDKESNVVIVNNNDKVAKDKSQEFIRFGVEEFAEEEVFSFGAGF